MIAFARDVFIWWAGIFSILVLAAARVSHSRRWMADREPGPNWFDGEILDAEIVD